MLESIQEDPKKRTILIVALIVVIVAGLGFGVTRLGKKPKISDIGTPPPASKVAVATGAAPGGAGGTAQAPATAPMGAGMAPTPVPPPSGPGMGSPMGGPPGGPMAGAPGGPMTPEAPGDGPVMVADAGSIFEENPVDAGDPKEPFRSNPFRPKAADRVLPLPMDDPANIFAERAFPQARNVRQPMTPIAEPLGVRPAYWMPPAPDIAVMAEPILPGLAVSPTVVAPPVIDTPVATQQAGPRVDRKSPAWSIRRVAGLLHDGIALAIIEAYEGDAVKTFVVKPGQSIVVGGARFVVRSIGRDAVTLREAGSTDDTVVRLRGRAANEE